MISRRALVGSGLLAFLPILLKPALAADTAASLELAYLAGLVSADLYETYEPPWRDYYLDRLQQKIAGTSIRQYQYYVLFRRQGKALSYVQGCQELGDPVAPAHLKRLLRHHIVLAEALRRNLDPALPGYGRFLAACDDHQEDAQYHLDRLTAASRA